MNVPTVEIVGAVVFALAVLHTFAVKRFQHLATLYPPGSIQENAFHLLGEVEVVFGVWAGILIAGVAAIDGPASAIGLVEKSDFTEPLFVFAVMTVAASRPVLEIAESLILAAARIVPAAPSAAFLIASLTLGTLLGSFITEPAAMTVTALLLRDRLFSRGLSPKLMYLMLGALFVNVSIGGVLTPYAAPPVLMVADTWGWDLPFMLKHFGGKAALAVALNAALVLAIGRRELAALPEHKPAPRKKTPAWLRLAHLATLAAIVFTAHHPAVFMGIFLFFVGLSEVTKEHQDELNVRASLLVGFFLAGLVVLGGFQRWWLEPLLRQLSSEAVFFGATALTAFTDNAAITFLGAQVPDVSESFKYALVAGAVAGGGLTVIANAPNPAGFSILKDTFGPEGISPLRLLAGAALPTAIAIACFWAIP